MKKLILSAVAVMALAATTSVKANTLSEPLTLTIASQDSLTKTPIKLEELPDSVKITLKSDQVKEWIPSDAYLVKNAAGAEYYQINVKKGEEKAFLRIGKDGKIIQ